MIVRGTKNLVVVQSDFLGDYTMPSSLKENLKLTTSALSKNLGVCWGQAKERLHVAAVQAMRTRNSKPELANSESRKFDQCDSVLRWIERLNKVIKEMPEVDDDTPVISEPEPSEPEPAPEPQPPVQIEK